MTEKRTDLALEVRESFPGNDVEVKGVILEKHTCDEGRIKVTTVRIKDDAGSRAMKKPKGSYVTIESQAMNQSDVNPEFLSKCVCKELDKMIAADNMESVLIVGLGNREVTSDSLGPRMIEKLFVTRHLKEELGENFWKENQYGCVSALAPGVMAQTGIETGDILAGVVKKIKPSCLVIVDALASRSVKRLCTTIQITDAGIVPGAGVGNKRRELSKKTLGVPVIAIGIPTVVDAGTIISDHLENVLEKQGYSDREIETFVREMMTKETENVIVTPKNIDESITILSQELADIFNLYFQKGKV